MKWARLTTAPNQMTAEMWRDLLLGEGIPAMVRGGDTSSYFGVTPFPRPVLVDESLESEARRALEGYLGRKLDA